MEKLLLAIAPFLTFLVNRIPFPCIKCTEGNSIKIKIGAIWNFTSLHTFGFYLFTAYLQFPFLYEVGSKIPILRHTSVF